MQVYEYPGIEWPPTFGGSSQRGDEFPSDVSTVFIEKTCAVVDETIIIINCRFKGRSHTCFLKTQDEGTAKGLAFWLDHLVGQTLEKLGDFPLDL